MRPTRRKNIFSGNLTRDEICTAYADFIYRGYDVTDLKDWDVGYKIAKKMSDLELVEWVEKNSDIVKSWREFNL